MEASAEKFMVEKGVRIMTIPIQKDIEALKEALAKGPTPGPWEVSHYRVLSCEPEIKVVAYNANNKETRTPQANIDIKYIAACSPDRISRLLAHIAQQASQLEALEESNADAVDFKDIIVKLQKRVVALEKKCGDYEGALVKIKWESEWGRTQGLFPINTGPGNVNHEVILMATTVLSQHKPSEGREG